MGDELGGLAYRARSISSPLTSISIRVNNDIYIYTIFITLCVYSAAGPLRLERWEHDILRITG